MTRKSLSLLFGTFLMTVFFAAPSAHAIEIKNESQLKIAAAILKVDQTRKTPLFVKILEKGQTINFTPPVDGALLASIKVFDTDETFRDENVQKTDVLRFTGKDLIRESAKK